jgi:hypothetical protein
MSYVVRSSEVEKCWLVLVPQLRRFGAGISAVSWPLLHGHKLTSAAPSGLHSRWGEGEGAGPLVFYFCLTGQNAVSWPLLAANEPWKFSIYFAFTISTVEEGEEKGHSQLQCHSFQMKCYQALFN